MEISSIIDTIRHDTTRPHNHAQKFSAVIPSIPQDIDKLLSNSEFFFKYLPIKNIYVIGPESITGKVCAANNSRIIFMNENEFVDVQAIRQLYSSRTDRMPGHFGWYVQQFVKMQFSKYTSDEYYLIWDSDTIPIKEAVLFDGASRPFFDIKYEFVSAYFETIKKLIPDLGKAINGSFVSEHMLIKCEYMRNMISEIENNHNVAGGNFQEKIINAIDAEALPYLGFSEFETYGNYVTLRYPDSYLRRKWRSLRTQKRFFRDASAISEAQREWLAKRYEAVSIETWQKDTVLSCLAESKVFRGIFSPFVLEFLDWPLKAMIPAAIRPFMKRIYSRIRSH